MRWHSEHQRVFTLAVLPRVLKKWRAGDISGAVKLSLRAKLTDAIRVPVPLMWTGTMRVYPRSLKGYIVEPAHA